MKPKAGAAITGDNSPLLYVLDSDKTALEAARSALTVAGYRVEGFKSARALLKKRFERIPACVITEWDLPDMSGRQLLEGILAQSPAPAVVVLTALNDTGEAVGALRGGAADFIGKPYVDQTLVKRVGEAIAGNAVH